MKCIDNGVNNVGRIGVGDRVEEFGTFIKCRHDRLQRSTEVDVMRIANVKKAVKYIASFFARSETRAF